MGWNRERDETGRVIGYSSKEYPDWWIMRTSKGSSLTWWVLFRGQRKDSFGLLPAAKRFVANHALEELD